MFAPLLAVVAPNADIVEAWQSGLQFVKLFLQSFLSAENLETVGADESRHHRIALPPAVALQGVLMVGIPDVIRGNNHVCSLLLCLCRNTHRQQGKHQNKRFNDSHGAKLRKETHTTKAFAPFLRNGSSILKK